MIFVSYSEHLLALKLARPVMIQFSEGGSAFVAGKALPNEKGKLQALPSSSLAMLAMGHGTA